MAVSWQSQIHGSAARYMAATLSARPGCSLITVAQATERLISPLEQEAELHRACLCLHVLPFAHRTRRSTSVIAPRLSAGRVHFV